MTFLHDRKAAHEARHAHDSALRFHCAARQGRLAGLWAAGLLGLEGTAAETYARDIAVATAEAPDDAAALRRLSTDLGDRVDPAEIRARLAEALHEARRQVLGEV